jgi:GntR family phosphonate transport system transcriptional regulator
MNTSPGSDSVEPVRLYMHISDILNREIIEKFKAGDVLPSESELAKRFSTNRHTVRMALEVLVTQGVVGKLQGKGTIVQQKPIEYPIHSSTRFTETLENCGRHAESRVLRKIGIPAKGEVCERLSIQDGEPVINIESLRMMDGAPFTLVSHYFPLDRMYEVMRKYEGGSLHQFINDTYGISLKRVVSLISTVLPEQQEAEQLDVSSSAPLLLVKSVNVNRETDEPIEFVISRFVGRATELIVEPS